MTWWLSKSQSDYVFFFKTNGDRAGWRGKLKVRVEEST
jgi:uncharacterized membrane protein